MKGKMQGVTLIADWDPKPGFKLGSKDIEGRQTYLGSQVWHALLETGVSEQAARMVADSGEKANPVLQVHRTHAFKPPPQGNSRSGGFRRNLVGEQQPGLSFHEACIIVTVVTCQALCFRYKNNRNCFDRDLTCNRRVSTVTSNCSAEAAPSARRFPGSSSSTSASG